MLATADHLSLWQLGLRIGALGLIVGSVALVITGGARPIGSSLRLSLEPLLQSVRNQTPLSRCELADACLIGAIVLAIASGLVEHELLAFLIVGGLFVARPAVRRATQEENRLLAIGGQFSTDLLIGAYAPVALAQAMTGNWLLGGCLLAVVVALSWPPGGGGAIPGRRWHLAPIPT